MLGGGVCYLQAQDDCCLLCIGRIWQRLRDRCQQSCLQDNVGPHIRASKRLTSPQLCTQLLPPSAVNQ